jgi:Mrp family chromosome partitioning ATPase
VSIIEKAASRIDRQRSTASTSPVVTVSPADAGAADAVVVDSPVLLDTAHDSVQVTPVLSATPAAAAAAAPAPAAEHPATPKFTTRRVELDLARMRELGMVTAAGGRTPLLEDFRIIKRPLLQRAFGERAAGDKPGNLIMITSSLPGEGKTYTAINLAMSIAMELDHTVLLVDADVARPSVLRTNVDTLSILPAGTSTPRATELLASSTMSSLVNEIASRYPDRIVIFDSPPLLLTSESRVLASHMGQIVMVVEAQTTTQHAVKEALSQLEGLNNVNLIYNKTRDLPGIEETYDYHYG